MKDFTVAAYRLLLSALQEQGYTFQTFGEFLNRPARRSIMLRHDVDARKLHSLEFARIQHAQGILGTYYFRVVPASFDERVIREIYELGHEVGYHYEDMDLAAGDIQQAIRLFEQNLNRFRKIVPVATICMHGSPKSKYDNRDIWSHVDYRDFGIIGEPYFDLNFREVFYLTDTGRRWDGRQVSVRDKVHNHFGYQFASTQAIIDTVRSAQFPEKAMFNFHPQRWTDRPGLWHWEKNVQAVKNTAKYLLIKYRNRDIK